MREHLPDQEICVVVNTAEDLWISGNHLSPDIDTLLYLFSGPLDTTAWWGLAGDTYYTHREALQLGADEFIAIGDRDRAMHIARGELLRQGCRLTGATLELSRRLGVKGRILPMTDTPVRTMIATDAGEIHFQEYWVRHRGSLAVRQVLRRWEEPPRATPEVLEALLSAEAVVIGPSNPITSILPILECEGVREALAKQQVLALSPFIGDTPVSGPAGALMRAWGLEPNSRATRDLYAAFLDRFIQDETDPVEVPGSVRLDTLMTSIEKSARLAAEVLALIRE